MARAPAQRALAVAVSLTVLLVGGCGEEDDLPEPGDDREGTEVVPGEEGPVD